MHNVISKNESSLSAGEQALWLTYQMAPESTADVVAVALCIRETLDVPALQRAFQTLVARHATLRTSFEAQNGVPLRRVAACAGADFVVCDAAGLPEMELRDRLAAEAQRPFALEQAPLLRARLFTRSPQEHWLLLAAHAIVADVASLATLLYEAGVCYLAECTGAEAGLAEDLPGAVSLDVAGSESLWAYWQAQLQGDIPAPELPLDYPRPWIQTYRGAVHPVVLPSALVRQLRAFCAERDVPLFTVALAAFSVLLYRYTGQDDLWLGSTLRLREGGIGPLGNTVVLRHNLAGNPPFAVFLDRVRRTLAGAAEHAAYPFAMLVERLLPERDFSRAPLVQAGCTQVALDHASAAELSALALGIAGMPGRVPGFAFETLSPGVCVAPLDLTLKLGDPGDDVLALLEYNADLFAPATIERMAGHWVTLLEGILAQPDGRIAGLPLLPADERRQLLVDWNATQVARDEGVLLHTLFEAQAAAAPDAVALVDEDQTLTYAELDARANQLARFLQALGVGPESRVGVCMERAPEAIVSMLGILKAGGCYTPLSPDYPQERLAFVLADAGAVVLLTQSRLASGLPESAARVVCVDSEWDAIAGESASAPPCAALPDNLAYIIYTSGSTGKPKGVLVPHRGIVNRMLWQREFLDFGPADRGLQKSPFVFDVSVGEICLPLVSGGGLVIARPGGQLDGAYLSQCIVEQQVTYAHFVPSLLRVFLKEPGAESALLFLRCVWCGGEALAPELQELFFERMGAALYNGYGPTEASVGATAWACDPTPGQEIVPIGRPIANTQVYLLDDRLQPVPVGVPGELHIGGLGLARGYLDRPGLTAAKFIPDPFSPQLVEGCPGARLYKTGDLARYRDDGRIEFLGRRDAQVKIRGFRVELGEIETTLLQHPAVREAVVDTCDDGQRLAAYAVAGSGVAPADLRAFLAQQLPDYMVPSLFVLLDAIPLTTNGKIDRKALAALAATAPAQIAGDDYAAPRTAVEAALARMWAEALGVERVGIYDSFFELGGHSLMVVQMMGRLQDVFVMDAPLIALFFESPTIASVADALMQSNGGLGDPDRIAQVLDKVATLSDEEFDAMLFDMEGDMSPADFMAGPGW